MSLYQRRRPPLSYATPEPFPGGTIYRLPGGKYQNWPIERVPMDYLEYIYTWEKAEEEWPGVSDAIEKVWESRGFDKPLKQKRSKSGGWCFPFGKHYGKELSIVPDDYMKWIVGKSWFLRRHPTGAKAIAEELAVRGLRRVF